MKTAAEIRNDFIDFFKNNKHKIVKSSPVIPQNDPTLLFTNAGMNQFKSIFLNQEEPSYPRVVDSQKCIRVSGKHNDLEEVGKDTYHHTFFEMLGNWSFGDYYKKEAIVYAWKLLTDVWKIPKERLWATVFNEDDEAAEFWKSETDISPDHILKYGKKDNFWEMGETGPCGPCSEIHYYSGNNQDGQSASKINADDPEYIELWNLVFIQYNHDKSGKLHPLPQMHVDTGAGLERIVAALQGKCSNYDTDLFKPIIDEIARLTGASYSEKSGMPHRVIADHIRMLSFSIGDGGMPSNEGRGYVIRRILRRAARYGRMLNMHEPFIYKLVDTVCKILGDVYPEIIERKEHIKQVILAEEQSFGETLDKGLEVYLRVKQQLIDTNTTEIKGSDIFKLYDTYGFPVDLTQLIAEEDGFTVDVDGFNVEMEKQKERARSAQAFRNNFDELAKEWIVLSEGADSDFIGYDNVESESVIRKYFIHDDIIHLVLDKTPFYAESGGEIGDTGTIINTDFKLDVTDTIKLNDVIVHVCRLKSGSIRKNPNVTAKIDVQKSNNIRANHTATHLLHAALRTVLGDHVHQKGSLVTAERLRFDLTHFAKIDSVDLEKIEDIVNRKIRENIDIKIAIQDYDSAKKSGAMALFGEKYEDEVRVITVGDFSKELCGGKHVRRTGDIGLVKIISESSVAAGIRRIEAITGRSVIELNRQNEKLISDLSAMFNSSKDNLVQKADELISRVKSLEKEIEIKNTTDNNAEIDKIWNEKVQIIKGVSVLTYNYKNSDLDHLKKINDYIINKSKYVISGSLSVYDNKPIAAISSSGSTITDYNFNAGELSKVIGKMLGGGGGGKPHLGTAGGKEKNKINDVEKQLPKIIGENLKKKSV